MSSLSKSPLYAMVNVLVLSGTLAGKIGVTDDTLEPIILRMIKLQNLYIVVNKLQAITLLLKKYNNISHREFV